jgi:hypothetical protein
MSEAGGQVSGQDNDIKEDQNVSNDNQHAGTDEADLPKIAAEGEQQAKAEQKPEPKAEEKPKPKQQRRKAKDGQEPGIGRIVHYVTASGSIRPAIISRVSDDAVDVTVFNSTGAVPVSEVPFDPEFPGETPGTVFWPEHN